MYELRDCHLLKVPDWLEMSPPAIALASQTGISFASCSCAKEKMETIHRIAKEKLTTCDMEIAEVGREEGGKIEGKWHC